MNEQDIQTIKMIKSYGLFFGQAPPEIVITEKLLLLSILTFK